MGITTRKGQNSELEMLGVVVLIAVAVLLVYGAVKTVRAMVALAYGAMRFISFMMGNGISHESQSHWLNGWSFNRSEWKKYFWKDVNVRHEEEINAIEQVTPHEWFIGTPESGIHAIKKEGRHKYNEFDKMFQNLLRNIRINASERQMFQRGFDEIIDSLISEMREVDSLFHYLFRKVTPAGSSWEDLRICSPDEFDVNLVLFPPDIQPGVTVHDLQYGHIGVHVPGGFRIDREHVLKALKLTQGHQKADASIIAVNKVKNWLNHNGFVKRDSIRYWMQSVVDSALLNLQDKHWTFILTTPTRRVSGPAMTLIVCLRTGERFSIDLVPAFEFSATSLPYRVVKKINERSRRDRTWYAIPKGPRTHDSPIMWRTSFYEHERDLMRGKELLKPCIRIMKKLKDHQKWKILASYYIKTIFMWEMEQKESWNWGLGQMMMHAMEVLEKSMRDETIKYYWDSNLNLLEGSVDSNDFYRNVANCLSRIIKKFERSLEDKSIDPMHCFGCDKYGNTILKSEGLVESESYSECVIM